MPAGLAAAGLACSVIATWRRTRSVGFVGLFLLAQAGVYLHTTIRGKVRVWERELDRLQLRGDERLLDLGCGRGVILIGAARRLPRGRAVGVDLWRSQDQTGNGPDLTRRNAAAAGVEDRIELHTADVTELPFADATFDLVTSALVLHNLPTADGRACAISEAMRVLRPGGRLLIADFRHADDYLRQLGPTARSRSLGPDYWYGGPWAGTTLVTITKP